jgi:hypothetical protein
MGGPDGRPRPTVGHLHFIDREAFNLRVPTPTSQFFFVPIYYLLFFFIPPPVLCLSPSQLSYDVFCLSHLVDLVGFRSCAHFLAVHVLSPPIPPPASISLRTYHVAQFLLPCDFSLSLSLLSHSLLAALRVCISTCCSACFRYRGFLADVVMNIS